MVQKGYFLLKSILVARSLFSHGQEIMGWLGDGPYFLLLHIKPILLVQLHEYEYT